MKKSKASARRRKELARKWDEFNRAYAICGSLFEILVVSRIRSGLETMLGKSLCVTGHCKYVIHFEKSEKTKRDIEMFDSVMSNIAAQGWDCKRKDKNGSVRYEFSPVFSSICDENPHRRAAR